MDITYKSNIDCELIQSMGGDHMVVAAARVSTNGADAVRFVDLRPDESRGLINYLMKHRHGTPFEHSSMTFFVRAPIFVWREWHRHRIGISYNEESGRYTVLKPLFYLPDRERPMMKVEDWKPGRPKFLRCEDDQLFADFIESKKVSYTTAYDSYIKAIDRGFDPGLARIDLPVGIYSGCWVTLNPRSMMNFLSLRVHSEESTFVSYPLWEIDVAARMCESVFAKGWPITYQAFVTNGRVAP